MRLRGAIAGCIAVGVALAIALSGVLAGLEDASVDQRFRMRPAKTPADVVVVALDERSLDLLGERPPIPRLLHARMLDRLRGFDPMVIAYDVQFTEETTRRDDNALYEAVSRTQPVVLGTADVTVDGDTRIFGSTANVEAAGASVGVTLLPLSRGGVFRRVEPRVNGVATLAFAAARAAGRAPRVERGAGDPLIDYAGPPGTVRTLAFADVLEGRVAAEALRGKAIVVGVTALSQGDRHRVPTAAHELMAGAEIQANALSTVLRGMPLREPPGWVEAALSALLAALGAAAAHRLGVVRLGVAATAALAAVAGGSYAAFLGGVVMPTAAPAAGLVVGAGITGLARELRARRRERELRAALARLAGDRDVEELLRRIGEHDLVLLAAGASFGDYEVDRALGVGAMSVVHLARDRASGRLVALKVMSATLGDRPSMRDRFVREAQAGQTLQHEAIVPVLDAGEVGDRPYIAMQLVDGGTLRDLVGTPMFTPIRAIELLRPIADALDHAHRNGIVHRDVKPSNILIDGDGGAYLADFGIAHLLDATRMTTDFLGTPAYTAPEQVRGDEPTGACDQYALACVLYECITGSVPFPERTAVGLMQAHLSEAPRAPSRVSRFGTPGIDRVLLRGLAKQPSERYGSCGELISAAAAALGSGTSSGADRTSGSSGPSPSTTTLGTDG